MALDRTITTIGLIGATRLFILRCEGREEMESITYLCFAVLVRRERGGKKVASEKIGTELGRVTEGGGMCRGCFGVADIKLQCAPGV